MLYSRQKVAVSRTETEQNGIWLYRVRRGGEGGAGLGYSSHCSLRRKPPPHPLPALPTPSPIDRTCHAAGRVDCVPSPPSPSPTPPLNECQAHCTNRGAPKLESACQCFVFHSSQNLKVVVLGRYFLTYIWNVVRSLYSFHQAFHAKSVQGRFSSPLPLEAWFLYGEPGENDKIIKNLLSG